MDEQIEQATAAPGEKRELSTKAVDRLHQFLLDEQMIPARAKSFVIRASVGRPLEITCEYYQF